MNFVFETSGVTGPPKKWIRTEKQLLSEVCMISETLSLKPDFIINFAPPKYIFGYLFGIYYPEILGIKAYQAWKSPFNIVDITSFNNILILCIPSTWKMLNLYKNKFKSHCKYTLLYSGANIPHSAYSFLTDVSSNILSYEILGSTETGGIAFRPISNSDNKFLWNGFPDVIFHRKNYLSKKPEKLVISSARIARKENEQAPPKSWCTSDIVSYVNNNQFKLIGRNNDIVKINGVKVNISEINIILSKAFPKLKIIAVPFNHDSILGEGYGIFWENNNIDFEDIQKVIHEYPKPTIKSLLPNIPLTISGKIDVRKIIEQLES